MSFGLLLFVNFGLYLVWMVLFAAFAVVLFGLTEDVEEHPEHPHILQILETAHRIGELSDAEYQRRKAIIEEDIRQEKRVA